VVVAGWVHTLVSLISRWKCDGCGRTFTWYPEFALPHKRYVLPEIVSRSQSYVETQQQSYRRGVQDGGLPIVHEQADEEPASTDAPEPTPRQEEEPVLAHSTLYRWVSTLGAWGHMLRQACRLVAQQRPDLALARDLARFRVAPTKYRSPSRRGVLHACRSLAVTEGVYASVFGVSIFPKLATDCHWT
jgi:hypothetical protein